ncbi:hypothetical protein GW758_00860 [Candidatus Falkowbacteria bacterium]|nr:hypothetical protein [Candidatus Falkowbacteria bacterium]
MKEELKIPTQKTDVIERRLDKQFIESQKNIIIGRIAKYMDKERIVEELRDNDVSPYILYKQQEVVPQLQKALRIIQEDKYGICLSCSGNIEIKRLIAVPAAFVCIACMRAGKTGS